MEVRARLCTPLTPLHPCINKYWLSSRERERGTFQFISLLTETKGLRVSIDMVSNGFSERGLKSLSMSARLCDQGKQVLYLLSLFSNFPLLSPFIYISWGKLRDLPFRLTQAHGLWSFPHEMKSFTFTRNFIHSVLNLRLNSIFTSQGSAFISPFLCRRDWVTISSSVLGPFRTNPFPGRKDTLFAVTSLNVDWFSVPAIKTWSLISCGFLWAETLLVFGGNELNKRNGNEFIANITPLMLSPQTFVR